MDLSSSEPSQVEILSRQCILDDVFRIEAAQLRFQRFDGSWSPPVRRLCFERGDSVAAVVYKPGARSVVLVQQFRFPAYERGCGWLLELVAGSSAPDESPATTIRREIEEETGYRIATLRQLCSFFVSPGGCSERVFLFYAEVDESVPNTGQRGLNAEHEDIKLLELSLETIRAGFAENAFIDAKTLIGLQWLLTRKDIDS